MSDTLRFDNRVVIVTGAGGGACDAYATFFASRGASVVVNDLGGSRTGGDGSKSTRAADIVVEEIVKAGGKAVANYDSVEEGEKIVETAVKAFGTVHIIINNAGILRDKSFARMTDDDWDLIHRVHVRGSYKVTKAAWEIMTKQGYGRVINTSSAAGIYGNFGQANYSAAKLALHGFTLSLALEGKKKGVFTNSIAPIAASRMTETVMPPDLLQALKPEFVVPLVALLTHESSTENGSLFEVGAGFVTKLRRERSKGAVFRADSTFTPGAVAAKYPLITDFTNPDFPQTISEVDWIGLLEKAQQLPAEKFPDLRFDGRVALITGAGAGLGRAYAHLFAKLGASVVVNDLGGSFSGQGSDTKAADVVVEELRALGAKAVANYDSVEDGEKLVETAIKAFGRIDIVVNNAGILRDKTFARATDADWDIIHRVHLRGTYKVTKAAWPHMVKQKYGRIINTTSAVGLYGNFGQTNYSAAKAGVCAFSNTLALEGAKNNIIVNTIAPNAGTRMTATVMPPEMVEALKPDYIAPLVGFLSHESTKVTGNIFEVGSGWIAQVRWQRTGGVGFPVNKPLLPEAIKARWADITNFDDGRAITVNSGAESLSAIQANLENKDDSPAASSGTFAPTTYEFSEKEVILYALGVGAKRTELPFVFELNDPFYVLPTFSVIPAFNAQGSVNLSELVPNFNPMMLLHGEQYTKVLAPFPTSGKVVSTARIIEVLDKGKAASVAMGITTVDAATGKALTENEFTIFIRGSGGFGGPKNSSRTGASVAPNNPPNRPADFIAREKTSEDQAALYRLSGDNNPLHIDPSFAAVGGFDKPILHGLCSYGIAAKHIMYKYGGGNPASIKSVKVRFAKHVFPGETLETHMWREGDKVIFQVKVAERNEIAISNAAVELQGEWAANGAAPAPAAAAPASSAPAAPAGFDAAPVFSAIEKTFNSLPAAERKALVGKTKAVFEFTLTNGAGVAASWFADLKTGEGAVGVGKAPGKADLAIAVSDKDFVDLAAGKLNAQKAFMSGKLKVKGNVALAAKLEGVLKLANAGQGQALIKFVLFCEVFMNCKAKVVILVGVSYCSCCLLH
ncbi:hypothetical protein DFJ73DRAFT_658898 [Zopfochytrium polystomum]|nr:hypothetical protein DFJ73DRAFT_658898 [Zopfochytrium polystomum]